MRGKIPPAGLIDLQLPLMMLPLRLIYDYLQQHSYHNSYGGHSSSTCIHHHLDPPENRGDHVLSLQECSPLQPAPMLSRRTRHILNCILVHAKLQHE
jgi:hypothetical protein